MEKGILGRMFDLNGDGKLNVWERAIEFQIITSMEKEEDNNLTELEIAGIDPVDLEYMNEYERREILEEAGLDPDDYDF